MTAKDTVALLTLIYRNYDYHPANPRPKTYDFCSAKCLQDYVAQIRWEDKPFSGLV